MKHIIRFTFYLAGLFLLAVGIVLSSKSNLGVSPVSSISLVLSNISSISLGKITTALFTFYVLLQILILRKRFKLKNLLQIFFGFILGVFVDFASILCLWIEPNNYFVQVLLMIISMFVVAIGIILVITMDIVPPSPDGLTLVLSDIAGMDFSKMKVWFDSISVGLAIVLSLVFLEQMSSIREGTIISALFIGKIIGVLSKTLKPWLRKLAFDGELE